VISQLNGTLLAVILGLVNPIILILIGMPWYFALAVTVGSVLLAQLAYVRYKWSLPTVYLINVAAIASVWMHGEALVQYRFADWVMDDLYHIRSGYYVNRPQLRKVLRDKEFVVDYVTNIDGYRIGAGQDPEVSAEQVDWLFLGDSYTQGAQVQFEQLYSTQLYHRFPSKIVLNTGVSGWGIHESLAFLKAEGERLGPSIVFLQVANFNDFMKVRERRASFTDWLMQESMLVRLALQSIKYTNPTNLPLGRWVEPFYATDEENRKFNVFYTPSSPEKDQDLRSFAKAIGEVNEQVRKIGAQLVLVQVPTKEQVSFTYLEEAVRQLHIDARKLDMSKPDSILKRLADSLKVRMVNLQPAFGAANTFPFYAYDEHLNEFGHGLAAEAIAQALTAWFGEDPIRMLSKSGHPDRYPTYNRKGDSILFQSFREGNSEILVADSSLTNEHRLTTDDIDESHPTRIPNSDSIIFTVGNASTGSTRLWISNSDGRNPTPLDTNSTHCSAIASASHDGRFIAYPQWTCGGPDGGQQLVLYDRKSGTTMQVHDLGDGVWRPMFSPSGRYVAYVARNNGQLDVYEFDLETKARRQLTSTPFDEWDPTYSPDGSYLAFSAKAHGNWDLFLLNLKTESMVQLTATRGDEWDATFAPDGSTLAFGAHYGLFRGIYSIRLPR